MVKKDLMRKEKEASFTKTYHHQVFLRMAASSLFHSWIISSLIGTIKIKKSTWLNVPYRQLTQKPSKQKLILLASVHM